MQQFWAPHADTSHTANSHNSKWKTKTYSAKSITINPDSYTHNEIMQRKYATCLGKSLNSAKLRQSRNSSRNRRKHIIYGMRQAHTAETHIQHRHTHSTDTHTHHMDIHHIHTHIIYILTHSHIAARMRRMSL